MGENVYTRRVELQRKKFAEYDKINRLLEKNAMEKFIQGFWKLKPEKWKKFS